LGRNKTAPLNDDDFLRALWIICFKYSRDTGRDYAHFLLDRHFSPRNVHETLGIKVSGEIAIERRSDDIAEFLELEELSIEPELQIPDREGKIGPDEIREFVLSLRAAAPHWFSSFYPTMVDGIPKLLVSSIERLNRVGMGYFRPLVTV